MAALGKMQALNQAIRQSLPGMAEVARQNPEARVLVRAVSFADRADWHIGHPTPVQELVWNDLQAGGMTAMGEALQLAATEMRSPPMEQRALPPVLVLISDGQPTDDFAAGLSILMHEPWAQKAVRLAIAVGHDADLEILQQFIGPEDVAAAGRSGTGRPQTSPRRPLKASNATSLAQYIQWASTAVLGAASMPASRQSGDAEASRNIPLPDLPPTVLDPMGDVGPLVW